MLAHLILANVVKSLKPSTTKKSDFLFKTNDDIFVRLVSVFSISSVQRKNRTRPIMLPSQANTHGRHIVFFFFL